MEGWTHLFFPFLILFIQFNVARVIQIQYTHVLRLLGCMSSCSLKWRDIHFVQDYANISCVFSTKSYSLRARRKIKASLQRWHLLWIPKTIRINAYTSWSEVKGGINSPTTSSNFCGAPGKCRRRRQFVPTLSAWRVHCNWVLVVQNNIDNAILLHELRIAFPRIQICAASYKATQFPLLRQGPRSGQQTDSPNLTPGCPSTGAEKNGRVWRDASS